MKRAPPLGPELRRMVWPLSPRDFFHRYYQKRHFVSHGPKERVRPIFDALGVSSVEQYLERRQEKVQVWYQTREGDYSVVETAPRDAAGLYRAGLTVYVNRVNELQPWKARLGLQLGFEEVGDPSLFAARRGSGTRWHFDKLENFTVQLQGTKRWRVAPNRQVLHPLENWVTRQPLGDEMRLYVPDALPRDAPPGRAETVELRPGSMLYLPRGYWHTAEASSGDTLAVTFLFASTTWVSRFIPALRNRLTALPAWREHAAWSLGDLRDDDRARAKAGEMLSELRRLVAQLRPEDFVPRESAAPRMSAHTRLRRNLLAFLHVLPPGEGGTRVVQLAIESLRPRRFDVEIESELAPVCLFIARQEEGSFLASEAAAAVRRVPFARVAALLRLLWEAGVLLPG